MSAGLRPALAHAFRRAALPLGWYYAVTLALPLANGAASVSAAFVGHALIVLVVPPMLIVLACAVHAVIRRVGSVRFSHRRQHRFVPLGGGAE